MRIKGLICVFAGHRWAPKSDADAGAVVLRCGRCGHEAVHSSETFGADEWAERLTDPWFKR